MVTSQLPLWSDRDAAEGWVVRESQRARRLTVRVFHSGRVEVVVPSRTSPSLVERFVERHRAWIERKRLEARTRAVPVPAFPPADIELSACAEKWLIHATGRGRRVRLRPAVSGPCVLELDGDSGDYGAVRGVLRRWLTERAAEVLGGALAECAREFGFSYQRVLIRRQRTRWGSCSTRGTVSLNCCLLFQRPQVVRYLLIHELAHTQHMNHSRRFWHTVARHCPQYRELDRELLDGWRRVPPWVFAEEDAS